MGEQSAPSQDAALPRDKIELMERIHGSRAELERLVNRLDAEQATAPGPDGWSVKDHLAHLALWDDIRASEVVRLSAGHDSAWRMTDEHGEAYNALGHALREALSLDQVRWELATSGQRLLDAIAAATPQGLDAARYGEAGLRSTHEAAHTGWIKRWRGDRGS